MGVCICEALTLYLPSQEETHKAATVIQSRFRGSRVPTQHFGEEAENGDVYPDPEPEPEPEPEAEVMSLDDLEVQLVTCMCQLVAAQDELSVLVRDDQSKLTVDVVEAKSLKVFELIGKMDVYAKLTLGSAMVPDGGTAEQRTTICKEGPSIYPAFCI